MYLPISVVVKHRRTRNIKLIADQVKQHKISNIEIAETTLRAGRTFSFSRIYSVGRERMKK